jgi:hypothetical protein
LRLVWIVAVNVDAGSLGGSTDDFRHQGRIELLLVRDLRQLLQHGELAACFIDFGPQLNERRRTAGVSPVPSTLCILNAGLLRIGRNSGIGFVPQAVNPDEAEAWLNKPQIASRGTYCVHVRDSAGKCITIDWLSLESAKASVDRLRADRLEAFIDGFLY